MLNKNDPLIGAVQQVMQQSNAEREATRLVNEAFGIEDRKALPHEYQAEWDAVYQQVLAEATHPSKYSKKQRDFAATAGDPTTIDSADLAHVRKHGGKHIGEEQIDEKTIAKKKAKKGTNYKVQATDSDREGSKITFRHGKRIKDEGDYDRGAGAFFMKKGTYGSAEDMLKTVKEEIAYNLAEQAEYVYENYGEEGLVEFIDSLTEEQFELLSMHEGWGDQPGSPFDRIKKTVSGFFGGSTIGQKTPQPGADSDKRPAAQQPGSAKAPGMGGPNYNPNKSLDAKAPGMGGPNYNPNKSLDAKAPGMGGPNYVPNKGITNAPPKPKVKPADLNTTPKVKKKSAPKAAAPKASAPKAAAQPKKKLTFFQKQELRRSAKNDTIDQTRNLERRYGVRAPMKKAKRSVFGEQIRDIIAQRIDEIYVDPKADTPAGRAYKQTLQKKGAGAPLQAGQKWNAPNRSMGSDPTNTAKGTRAAAGPKAAPALDPTRNVSLDQPATKSPMAAALNRQDLAKSVQAGRVGDPGKQNFIQNARAQKEREKAAGGDGSKYLPFSPAVQQAVKDNQPQPGRAQTLSPGANPPVVSKNMGGGAGDYRKAQASPIKVSDTEVMNDPKFKKALSSVGGTQAAKKIQTGERVAGLGRMNKGDTIMSRVRTDIAARKNVGRES